MARVRRPESHFPRTWRPKTSPPRYFLDFKVKTMLKNDVGVSLKMTSAGASQMLLRQPAATLEVSSSVTNSAGGPEPSRYTVYRLDGVIGV